MGILDLCSYNSYWRGLDYYQRKKVKNLVQLNQYEYNAQVEGTETYNVHLDINHPRKTTCTCPHAAGKRIICKHKAAAYFSIFPEEAQKAIDERKRYYEELERIQEEHNKQISEKIRKIKKYVNSLSEKKAKQLLINYMIDTEINDFDDDEYEDELW